jgi:hypothetical protein
MAGNPTIWTRWDRYRPSKAIWFWSCVVCFIATLVVGFNWGGWVTGGTATRMAADAASRARTDLVADACVNRFEAAPDASAQLDLLKKTESYKRADLIKKAGWATIPGNTDSVEGAADRCAQQLVAGREAAAKG